MTYCFIIPNVRSNHLLALHAEHENSYNCSGATGGHAACYTNVQLLLHSVSRHSDSLVSILFSQRALPKL
jgi:hypothetical protein